MLNGWAHGAEMKPKSLLARSPLCSTVGLRVAVSFFLCSTVGHMHVPDKACKAGASPTRLRIVRLIQGASLLSSLARLTRPRSLTRCRRTLSLRTAKPTLTICILARPGCRERPRLGGAIRSVAVQTGRSGTCSELSTSIIKPPRTSTSSKS
jgi:hypothetical protein